jgi:PhoH-like ATPase
MSVESQLNSDPALGRRTFVLDTNVLLYDPNSLNVFGAHDLVIPITVIEEIDRFKKDLNETGRNARMVSRKLDELRRQGSLSDGVNLENGTNLRVVIGSGGVTLPEGFGPRTNDNLILATVLSLAQEKGRDAVVMVTRDTNMRIKADAMGVIAEDYEHAHIEMDETYTGVCEMSMPSAKIGEVYSRGWVPWSAEEAAEAKLQPHQFVVAHADENNSQTALLRYDATHDRMKLVGRFKEGVWGIFARNKEQLFALELLLDDSLSLVTLDGKAGTGKTLLAIACGLRLVADEARFRRLVVSRPIFPLGRDLGFLPGDIGEKLNPWMKPIFDNLDLLVGSNNSDDGRGNGRRGPAQPPSYQPLLDQGLIEIEPLTYIRGRSLPRQYLIVDEAQNLTPHEVKTVITRAGEGTKVILTGDPYQIDNPYVDATSNGLTYVVERFKESPVAGHITLKKGERSELAELAANLL